LVLGLLHCQWGAIGDAVQSYVRGIEPPEIAKLSTDVHEFVDVSAHLRVSVAPPPTRGDAR
jgi:hypothetical protein